MSEQEEKWWLIVVTERGARYTKSTVNAQVAIAAADQAVANGYTFESNPNGEVDVIPASRIVRAEVRYGQLREVS